jgi:hypothetical protein
VVFTVARAVLSLAFSLRLHAAGYLLDAVLVLFFVGVHQLGSWSGVVRMPLHASW